jgi:hypothetical protein
VAAGLRRLVSLTAGAVLGGAGFGFVARDVFAAEGSVVALAWIVGALLGLLPSLVGEGPPPGGDERG